MPAIFQGRLRLAAIAFLFSVFQAALRLPALAQDEVEFEPLHYQVQAATSPIVVDGVLDEAAWDDALVVDKLWEWTPGENVEPPVRTEFLVTYDERRLYVGARALDPEPSLIRAHLMDRDAIDTMVQDDYILVMIDSFNDQRRAFQFRVNPLGVQADSLNSFVGGGSEDWSWDIIWDAKGRITPQGYIVEIAFPLNQLPFPAGQGAQTWRINLGRSWPRGQRHRMASHKIDFDDVCFTCNYSYFEGFAGMKPGSSFEVIPTLTARNTERKTELPDGDFDDNDDDVDPGVSGRFNLSPSSRLSFAVNPDFSQVEADAGQLDVNQRFALFFPEQRPFFLEGTDVFQTPINAVFTRTVVDPDVGLKLTGKEGKNAYGVFVTQDTVNNVLLPGNQGSAFVSSADGVLDSEVLGSVLRYRRDVGRNHSVGVLYAGREADNYWNRVSGVDASFQIARSDRLNVQALHSETDYPDPLRDRQGLSENQIGGNAFAVNYFHNTREWNWSANYRVLDRDFRADSGFVPRVDIETAGAHLSRTWWHSPESFLVSSQVGVNAFQSEDRDGLLTDRKVGLSGFFQGPKQSSAFVQTWNIDKRNGSTLYEDLRGGELFGQLQPTGSLSLALYVAYEDEVDFRNDRQADLFNFSPEIGLKIGKRTQAELGHSRRSFELEGDTYLTADLTELRLFYHFSTRSFVRAIVQRTAIKNDPAFFIRPVERESEDVFTQLLFSYKLNAQTVLFAGYSDNRLGGDAFSLTQTDRTLFLKLGYAFLF